MPTNLSDNEVIVVMAPFPEYSHLNQLSVVARFIASHNVPVHFLCHADRNQELKLRVQGGLWATNIHFHDLLLSSHEEETEDGLPPIATLLKKLAEPIRRTCIDISTNAKRLLMIHDSIMTDFIRDVHSVIPKMESYMFHSISAFARYSTFRQSVDHIVVDEDDEKRIEQMHHDFPLLESSSGPYASGFIRDELEWELNSGEIMNSCREVESKYLDLLAHAKGKHCWAVGPLHMLLESHNSSNRTKHECLEFLDNQDVNSVIFVSFGATTTFSRQQVNELAFGLERSNHKFIWVLRKADKNAETEIFEERHEKIELPERVEGRGIGCPKWKSWDIHQLAGFRVTVDGILVSRALAWEYL